VSALSLLFVVAAALGDDYQEIAVGQLQALSATTVTEQRATRWLEGHMQCRYNPAGSPLPLATVEAAIRKAGEAWELKSGFSFEYAGTTQELPRGVVRDCLISWDLFSSPFKLGQTQNYRIDDGYVGSDIRLSRLLDSSRLQMVLRHEIGHGLGLRHNEQSCIMRSSPSDAALCFADYAGVSYLYPPYEVDGRPALDCSANLLPGNELYIPSIDGHYWARYRLRANLDLVYIEHGELEADEFFVCK
jgi:hypothetical protein